MVPDFDAGDDLSKCKRCGVNVECSQLDAHTCGCSEPVRGVHTLGADLDEQSGQGAAPDERSTSSLRPSTVRTQHTAVPPAALLAFRQDLRALEDTLRSPTTPSDGQHTGTPAASHTPLAHSARTHYPLDVQNKLRWQNPAMAAHFDRWNSNVLRLRNSRPRASSAGFRKALDFWKKTDSISGRARAARAAPAGGHAYRRGEHWSTRQQDVHDGNRGSLHLAGAAAGELSQGTSVLLRTLKRADATAREVNRRSSSQRVRGQRRGNGPKDKIRPFLEMSKAAEAEIGGLRDYLQQTEANCQASIEADLECLERYVRERKEEEQMAANEAHSLYIIVVRVHLSTDALRKSLQISHSHVFLILCLLSFYFSGLVCPPSLPARLFSPLQIRRSWQCHPEGSACRFASPIE